MPRHAFEFAPVNEIFGWSIGDDGAPSVWWRAQLSYHDAIVLSDGSDARGLEANIRIRFGRETAIGKTLFTGGERPELKWGYIHRACASQGANKEPPAVSKYLDCIDVLLVVSSENFDRILASVRDGRTPTILAGIARDEPFKPLVGRIATRDGKYFWDNANFPTVPIETCEINYSQGPKKSDVADFPDEPGSGSRNIEIAVAVIGNVARVAVALAAIGVAQTKFESVIICLLLLMYTGSTATSQHLARGLAAMEYAGLDRYFKLRALVGVPKRTDETRWLEILQKKVAEPTSKFWLDSIGLGCIAAIAATRLIALFM